MIKKSIMLPEEMEKRISEIAREELRSFNGQIQLLLGIGLEAFEEKILRSRKGHIDT